MGWGFCYTAVLEHQVEEALAVLVAGEQTVILQHWWSYKVWHCGGKKSFDF
jgi:hypothetical protein